MNFIYEPALLNHMQAKRKETIIVEVISSNTSDFDVTELHVYLANEKKALFFLEQKHFRSIKTPHGQVLLPPYHLEYDDTVTFGLKSFLGYKYVTYKGIRL